MMKNLLVLASGAVLASAIVSSCGDSDSKRKPEVEINSFAVNQVIMTADRNFRVVMMGDTTYLDQYVSIHWPKSLGGADVKVLQDSLMAYCFGDSIFPTPEDAITYFVSDTSVLGDSEEGLEISQVDSLPANDDMRCYFNNVMATVMELDEVKVTYQVTSSTYLGGAHPSTAIHPFTYDLAEGRVLGLDDILTQAGRDSIMPIIVSALARQLDVPESRLSRAGIFTSQLTYPGQPYINNNILYFHYNPYDIAPYSSGMIDVAVYPYEVERFLQPGVKNMFDLGY